LTTVEVHAEEEQVRGMDLDTEHAGGVDLDIGGGWHGTSMEAVDVVRRRSDQQGTSVEAVSVV
jgi:hypothetical protein